MNHNEQILQCEHNRFLYLEEYPAPFEPVATVFEDAEQEIIYFTNEYIAEHDQMPDIDDVAIMFSIKEDADWEALEKYFKREMEMTEWSVPSMK